MTMINIPTFLLSTKITIKTFKEIDDEGQPKYNAAFDTMCRLQENSTGVMQIDGDIIYYNAIVYLRNTEKNITIDSICSIGASELIVKKIDKIRNADGSINHLKLWCN
jgi:aspartate aminotransferase-like enzyme